jgi:sterol desaturase/sphingolipid hydroxylase (fatty acid hydroxylase superfamily)
MVSLMNTDFLIHRGDDLQYIVFATVLVVMLLTERLRRFRAKSAEDRQRWSTNSALTAIAIVALGIIPVSFVGAGLWAKSAGVGLVNIVALPDWIVVVVTLALRGAISTGTHLLNHRLPWLWRLHRVHHLDTQLDVSSTVRLHPLELPINALIGLPIVIALGLSPWVLALYELLDIAVTLISHANIQLPRRLNRWLSYVVVTPNLHRVHHSTHQPETDSNFGAVFPIWDLLLGTFRTQTREPQREMSLGLDELRGPAANRLGPLLVSPLYKHLAHYDSELRDINSSRLAREG